MAALFGKLGSLPSSYSARAEEEEQGRGFTTGEEFFICAIECVGFRGCVLALQTTHITGERRPSTFRECRCSRSMSRTSHQPLLGLLGPWVVRLLAK